MDKHTISVTEAAKMIGISRQTAYSALRKTGELAGVQPIRIGQQIILIPRAPLEAALGIPKPVPPPRPIPPIACSYVYSGCRDEAALEVDDKWMCANHAGAWYAYVNGPFEPASSPTNRVHL